MTYMTKTSTVFLLLLIIGSFQVQSQSIGKSRLVIATELLDALTDDQKQMGNPKFTDPKRITWERLPGERDGIKLTDFSHPQKVLLHQLMQQTLSKEGYFMVTTLMFNEDIQQKFEPNLGKNEYWFELFGQPDANGYWGWQLEGHHLSINLTFKGESIISNTPFLMSSNPQVVDSDDERNGLCFVFKEEMIAESLVNSLDQSQKKEGYSPAKRPKQVYAEKDKNNHPAIVEGIKVAILKQPQQQLVDELINTYASYFPQDLDQTSIDWSGLDTRFFFMQNPAYNGEHYYRLSNQKILLECENYGNHTHHYWRSANDYGKLFMAK